MKRLTALVFLALVLSGCGPTEGTVVEKVHFPDLSYWTVTTVCSNTCVTGPHWVHIPECYRLKVRTPEDKLETTCVDSGVFRAINEGDYWREDKS